MAYVTGRVTRSAVQLRMGVNAAAERQLILPEQSYRPASMLNRLLPESRRGWGVTGSRYICGARTSALRLRIRLWHEVKAGCNEAPRRIRHVLIPFMLTLGTGCGGDQPPAPNVPTAEFRATSRFAMTGTRPVMRAVDAAFTPDNRVMVLDQLAPGVHVFDSTGRYIETLGRQGAGPGELTKPTALAVSPNSGLLAVSDESLGRIVIWTQHGIQLHSLNRRTFGVGSIAWGKNEHLYLRSMRATKMEPSLSLEEFDPKTGDTRDILVERQTPKGLMAGGSDDAVVCSPCPIAISRDGLIAQAPTPHDEYRVSLARPDGHFTRDALVRVIEPLALTAQQRRAARQERDQFPPHLRTFLPLQTHLPFITSMAFDDLGHLWVQAPSTEGSHFDVYSTALQLLERVYLESSVMPVDVRSDRILGITFETSSGEYQVRIFERPRTAAEVTR